MSRATDLAWAAGFFDGEGSVCIGHQVNRRYARLTLEIHQASEQVLRRWADVVGVEKRIRSYNKKGRANTYWRVSLQCRKAADVLQLLMPYLIHKRDVAELGIVFQATMGARDHGGDGRRLSEETFRKRDAMALQMKELNGVH